MKLGCKVVNAYTDDVGWITAIGQLGELRISHRSTGAGLESWYDPIHWKDSRDCCYTPEVSR